MKIINNILCVVEPDGHSVTALKHAVRIASDHQANITVMSLIKSSGRLRTFLTDESELAESTKESISLKENELITWVKKSHPKLKFKVEVHTGVGFIEIIRSVVKNEYDLLIKCADDVDWLTRLFGSDDMNLIRKCPCPVLMLKAGQGEIFRSVLATVDVSDDFNEYEKERVQDELNNEVLEYSVALAVSQLTELHVGSVWDACGEDFLRYSTFSDMPDEKIDDYVAFERQESANKLDLLVLDMRKRVGKDVLDYLHPKLHLVKGEPSVEIPSMVKDFKVDLIVMGTVARTGIPGLIIGNTAEAILEQVQCSVLAIKPPGFITPVQ